MVYTYVFDDLVQHGWVEGDEEGEGDGDSEVKGELEGLQSNTLPAGTAASTKHNELTQLVHVVAAPLSLSLSPALSLPQFFLFFVFRPMTLVFTDIYTEILTLLALSLPFAYYSQHPI